MTRVKSIPQKNWTSLSTFKAWLKENRKSEKIVDFLGHTLFTNTHVYGLAFGELRQQTLEEYRFEQEAIQKQRKENAELAFKVAEKRKEVSVSTKTVKRKPRTRRKKK